MSTWVRHCWALLVCCLLLWPGVAVGSASLPDYGLSGRRNDSIAGSMMHCLPLACEEASTAGATAATANGAVIQRANYSPVEETIAISNCDFSYESLQCLHVRLQI